MGWSRAWRGSLLGVVVVASGGTLSCADEIPPNPPSVSGPSTRLWQRNGIEGGSIELSADDPNATFDVVITATALVDTFPTTNGLSTVRVVTQLTPLGSNEAGRTANVSVELRSPNAQVPPQTGTNAADLSTSLTFLGNCDKPNEGSVCAAGFEVALSRLGADDDLPAVRVDWSFDLVSESIDYTASGIGRTGPNDPPWQLQINRR